MYTKYPAFDIDLVTDNIVSGRLCLSTIDYISNIIAEEVNQVDELENASIGEEDDEELFPDVRKGTIHWLIKSQEGTDLIDKLVEEINVGYFNLDISNKAIEYQFTVYDNVNDHYDWHQDRYDDDGSNFVRQLSISVCLSSADLYDGAELFIKDGSDSNVRVFKMKYGDFVVFPSKCKHRVNALREGRRISLVIWYGHYND
jgi:predicted 2-oxoglutarate/Fe(II)-dependent dioxygenase YbiX